MIQRKRAFPALVSVKKIWNQATHNALTDLIRFNNLWFCVFRESDTHQNGKNGTLRLLSSRDALEWKTSATFSEPGIDLRDPKLSITPFGKLMLLTGGTVLNDFNEYVYTQSKVTFSEDGIHWDPFLPVLEKHEWLWRLTWYQGEGYGVAYSRSNPRDRYQEWNIKLFKTSDGTNYSLLTTWDLSGYPNETTLRFLQSGQMVAVVRREKKKDNHSLIGLSSPPYTSWRWHCSDYPVGGPNFLVLPHGDMWISGRLLIHTPYATFEKTFLGTLELDSIHPLLLLPSEGDCSYPGMVFHEGMLWISYYSSHEDSKASIYLARIAI